MPGTRGSATTAATRVAVHLAVRHAGVEDLDCAAPLFDAYRQFYGVPSDLAAARAFLATRLERDESVVLLAFSESPPGGGSPGGADVVGFTQLYRSFSSVSLGTIIILNDLFVVPSARRCGVAGCLVDAAAAYARRAGAIRLELATQHTNGPALRLYLAKGFVADVEFTHLSLRLSGMPDTLEPPGAPGTTPSRRTRNAVEGC